MGTLPDPMRPFSSPHRPVNAMTATEQLRGNDNQTQKALNDHTQDASLHSVTTETAGVTTSAVAIYAVATGLMVGWVAGDNGSGKTFVDNIVWNGATNVVATVSSTTVDGAPDARTYTVVLGVLKLTMAAGTYSIALIPFSF